MSNPSINLTDLFAEHAPFVSEPNLKSRTVPVSFRVTLAEKEQLQREAGKIALSAHLYQKVLGNSAEPRPARYTKKQRQPKIDTAEVAKLLATFGQSEIGRSMLALSLAVQMGELEV